MNGRSDREEAGRTATARELKLKLPEADAAFMIGALRNPALNEELVLEIVKNPAADQTILHAVGGKPEWTRSYKVKRELVRHPKTPHALAMNFVKFLFWKDLHVLGTDQFAFPPLRRLAEKTLLERLPQLALGEKMTLGRIAGRAIIPKLLADKNPMVVETVLWNGRLTSHEILTLISDRRTQPDVLSQIARHPKWTTRAEIRVALAHNPRTPLAISLGLLRNLTERDLTSITEDAHAPQAVRVAARRALSEAAQRRRGR